tara:strand:- start:381 stop:560 length:180 start_codon:yes stop_codon:yes gene_type:complete
MPNVRKEGKKSISAWIYEDDKAALQKFAKERDIPLSDLLDELIKEKLDRLKKKNNKIRK